MRRDLAFVLVALLVAVSGCGRDGGHARVSLDGSPRVPDDEGIVTAVDLSSITLDGDRTYAIDDELQSFSNIDLQPVPLLYTEHQYVQLGADGHTARWIATVAKPLGSDPPRVLFSGTVRRVDDAQLVFANGTVLRIADGVHVDDLGGEQVDAWLRPDERAVTEVEAR